MLGEGSTVCSRQKPTPVPGRVSGCMSAADFATPVSALVKAYMRDARKCNVVTLSEGGGAPQQPDSSARPLHSRPPSPRISRLTMGAVVLLGA